MRAASRASFDSMLNRGQYLAHLHTSLTDGTNTIDEICRWADDHGYTSAVFSEHIRREPTYSFDAYKDGIERARATFPSLDVWTGVEAKVFPGGGIDCSDDILKNIDVLYIACHSFSGDVDAWADTMRAALGETHESGLVRVWAHPGRFLARRDLLADHDGLLMDLMKHARDNGVYIERNLRDGLPPESLLADIGSASIITGIDAHSIADLERFDALR